MSDRMEPPDETNWGLDFDELMKAAVEIDEGRWDWEKIHVGWTGKDADLEPWGHQGIELVDCYEDGVNFIVHCYKTFAGDDVCLNIPDELEDKEFDEIHEMWLDQAQEVVMGCGSAGEWDGDSWGMTLHEAGFVPWVYKEDGVTPDYKATIEAAVEHAQEIIKPWEDEIVLADKIMNMLAGWYDDYENRTPDGEYGKGSVYTYWKQEKENSNGS